MKDLSKKLAPFIIIIATTFGSLKVINFLQADKCLDLGGMVTTWGACQFGEARPEYILVPFTSLLWVILVGLALNVVAIYILRKVFSNVPKT